MFSAGGVPGAFIATSAVEAGVSPAASMAAASWSGFRPSQGSVAAPMRTIQLPHCLLHGLVHAQRVRALRWREVLEALQVRGEERTGRRRRPQLRGEELAPDVAPLVRLGIHLLHRVHAQIEDVGYTRVRFLVPPAAFLLHPDVHLPV